MGYLRPDPYYNPDEFGLESYGEFELSEPCYSFNTFAVWRDKETGEFLWSRDSGCSCPSPFEAHTMDDLES